MADPLATCDQYNFLFLGISQIIWVPIAVKWGKRPALIASMLLLFIAQIWAAEAKSFDSLLAARCVIGLASGAGEVSQKGIRALDDSTHSPCVSSSPSSRPSSPTSSSCTNELP